MVDFHLDEDAEHGKSFVELHFADEDKRKVLMADRRAEDITRMMTEKSTELETRSVLKEVRVKTFFHLHSHPSLC